MDDKVGTDDPISLPPAAASQFARKFLDAYLQPAFGARSKAEIDLLVFDCLVGAGIVDPFGPLYPLARLLNVTPQRARNLVFNWQLRTMPAGDGLREPLIRALQSTRFSRDGTLLTFGIESPLLKEEVTARLKAKGYFADASFSREIVRLPVEAFVEFLADLLDEETKKAFRDRLVRDRQLPEMSFKAIATGVLARFGESMMGAISRELAQIIVGKTSDFLGGLLTGNVDEAVRSLDGIEI
ncbi:hypothetical protein [Rhizobium binxianense]